MLTKFIYLPSLVLALACPDLMAAPKPTNKQLNIGITQEFENMNPIVSQMLATTYLRGLVLRQLNVLSISAKEWEPQLAVRIPSFENGGARFVGSGKDRKIESDWEINPKAVWGDGSPITAEDVIFSRTVALSPNVSVGERQTYADVEKIVPDPANPRKFKLITAAKWDFGRLGTFFIVPKHLEEAQFKKFGAEKLGYEKNSLYTKDPTNAGLYNGPYVVTDLKLGDHVTFGINPKWWGKKPAIEKINIKLIPISSALESNLRSGTIDMISVLGLSFDEALTLDKRVKSERLPYQVIFKPSLVYEHMDVNLRNPILSDARVRKALVYGINRDELVKGLFESRQRKAIHWLSPNDPWFTEDPAKVVLYPYSTRQAEKLLESAGWQKKAGQEYRSKEGQKLSLTLHSTAGNKVRELVEVFLQNEWKKIGVELVIKNEPARVFFGETVRKGQYPGLAMFSWVSSPENSPRSTFSSASIPTKANGFSGQNSGGWNNPEVDKLLLSLETEFDAQKRIDLVGQLIHHYTDEVPVIPLYYRSDVVVVPANLKGYQLPGHQFPDSNWAENWSLQ